MSVMMPTLVRLVQTSTPAYSARRSRLSTNHNNNINHHYGALNTSSVSGTESLMSLDDFTAEVERLFNTPVHGDRLLQMSTRLQHEYREKLFSSPISMLPSFQHTLPTGQESGHYLALDVGGSTFRIALIRLQGGSASAEEKAVARQIKSFVIDEPIRMLRGRQFFDWMAERIEETLVEYTDLWKNDESSSSAAPAPLKMGLAWSFPVQQTSPRSGKLLAMGKGFLADNGLEGEDLGGLVVHACQTRGLPVEMWAIVNDGAATLLSKAYHDPSTRMSLILGTGMNAAVHLPVAALGTGQFGDQRPAEWYAAAQRVVVNTELSMFGKAVFPTTRWDEELNAQHIRRDFQPLEYLVTGRYLGEIVRLVLVEAIATAGLFGGHMPARLSEAYSFETRLLALFEADDLAAASRAFLLAHPLPRAVPLPQPSEWKFLRTCARLVSRRAAAYLAIAIHALWAVRSSAEGLDLQASPAVDSSTPGTDARRITVACDGSMVEKYPGFRPTCQAYLDRLCGLSCGNGTTAAAGTVTLEMTPESSIFGAAIAASCNAGTES